MKTRKLIAVLICAIMCLAMLPAQAETAMESHFLSDIGVTISIPESWYAGEREDGLNSELAQAFNLDQAGFESVFVDGLHMCSCPDLTANQQLQVIVTDGQGIDMRSMTDSEKNSFLEGIKAAESSGMEIISCEMYSTPYTNYGVTYYKYGGFYAIQYITAFDDVGYLFQYCDYSGNPIDDSAFVLMAEIIDTISFGYSASPITEFSIPSIPAPYPQTGLSAIYIPDLCMTVSVPEEWYTGLYTEGASSELATAFALTDADIEYMYNSNGILVSCFATPDLTGNAQLQVVGTVGIAGVDMRTDEVEWDAFIEGFLSTFNAGTVVESVPFVTGASQYIKVYSLVSNGYSTFPMLQYITNFNDTMYLIQYFDFSVTEFDADTIAFIDDIVSNATFD